jgi:isopenicillin N synthase-like dioxygenase
MSTNSSSAFSQIPIIDLNRLAGDEKARRQLCLELCDICHHTGFFQLLNHGIDRSLVDGLFTTMRQLFDLPEQQKKLIDKRNSRHFRGWEAVGTEFTNNRPDIREQVDIWTEWPARAADVQPDFLRLLGPNQWLPEKVLPGYRDSVLNWMAQAGALADRLLEVLAEGLELAPDHITRLFGEQRMSLTKLIHYPATPQGAAGVNAHHDTGFLTILAPGSVAGLQVENQQGEWIDVPATPGALVVNLGEMLQAMTGNYFVATPHRVITREERYSMAYFHGPSLQTALSPLPLARRFRDAVEASPHHSNAGFMARKHETESGTGDMQSKHKPDLYGEQLWNYFSRSYPQFMAEHYASESLPG